MAEPHRYEPQVNEEGPLNGTSLSRLELDDLKKVKLRITVELGRAHILVRQVLEMKKGTIVTLDKAAGEMTDILVNGLPLAKGEVVVIGDALHVRIAEITGVNETTEENPVDA